VIEEHKADEVRTIRVTSSDVRAEIGARYSAAAQTVLLSSKWGCPQTCGAHTLDRYLESGPDFGPSLYSPRELALVPPSAARASLGCGSPTKDAHLRTRQIVLDVGCGGGIDSILAAIAVTSHGLVVGVDLSADMVMLARSNAAEAGTGNAHFITGLMEQLPVRDQLANVVISNSVINLSTEKERSLSELFRVLVPGGRLHVIDLVADDSLSPADRMERVTETNATAGLYSVSEYCSALTGAGFQHVGVAPRHEVADRVIAALVTATRPHHGVVGNIFRDDDDCGMMCR
jgi:arsenite methyltransferase